MSGEEIADRLAAQPNEQRVARRRRLPRSTTAEESTWNGNSTGWSDSCSTGWGDRREARRGFLVTPARYAGGMPPFRLHSEFEPAGDQPQAIDKLAEGIEAGDKFQTLLGITGSGKSATMAWTIEKVQRPTLVIAPNKALAAQLANEFRQFFPENRVEYFVSYYDYYQPEAYMPQTDTFIEKDATVNDEIDRLRHAATSALLDPRRRHHRRLGVLHLRSRHPRDVPRSGPATRSRRRVPRRGRHAAAHRHPVRAERDQCRPRQVPGEGRHARGLSLLRGDGRAGRMVGRRGRADPPHEPASPARSSRR